jgi:extradiol dioxygenase family protein
MDPVLHLSIVVADLDEASAFYVDMLGCRPGRTHEGWMDVWFFGLQLTLQLQPEYVLPPGRQGNRHFGVTLDAGGFETAVARLHGSPDVTWVAPVSTDHAGTPRQQTKCKVADPSGNVIEFKTYVDPAAALAP